MPIPIQQTAESIDLGPRIFNSIVVAASPSAATETTICTLTLSGDLGYSKGAIVLGYAAFTVGTSGASSRLRVRQTNTSGATVADTGATTGGIAAGNLVDMNVGGIDTAPGTAQVYVLTLTIGSGAATSTVSNVQLLVICV